MVAGIKPPVNPIHDKMTKMLGIQTKLSKVKFALKFNYEI
jgi:hypothetical protein